MKRTIAIILSAIMVIGLISLTGCAKQPPVDNTKNQASDKSDTAKKVKVGFVYIGDINDGGYNQSHDKARLALEAMGVECMYKENVPESSDCENAIRELIDAGCNVIYTTSFGFMDYTEAVAKEYPDVYFGHATGYKTAVNMCNYMGKIEEARYLTGIVAGMATKSNKIGYVMAMPYAECIRGCNAFTLGVQSVNKDAKVEIMLVNSWTDVAAAKQAAIELLNKGCDVIAQHHDATAVQLAAQEKGALCIGYNMATPDVAPKAYLTAAVFNWAKFYTDNVKSIQDGTWKAEAYWKGLDAGWVDIAPLSSLAPAGAQAKVDEAKAKLLSGELKLFQGEIKDQSGAVKAINMTDDQIYNMDWLIQGVEGSLK